MRRSVAILLLAGVAYVAGQNAPLPSKTDVESKPNPHHPPPPPPPPPSYVIKIVIPPPPMPPHGPPPKPLSAESQELPSGHKSSVDVKFKPESAELTQAEMSPKVKRAADNFKIRARRSDSAPQQGSKFQLPSSGVPVGLNSGSQPSGLPPKNDQASGLPPKNDQASGLQNSHPIVPPALEPQNGQASGSPPSGSPPALPPSNPDNKPKTRARRSDDQNNLSDQFGGKALEKGKQSPGQIYKQLGQIPAGQLDGNLPKTKRDVSNSNEQGASELTGQLEHVPAEFPGGDRPYVQETQNGPVPGVVGQNSAVPGQISGGQKVLNNMPPLGMPNDAESVEDQDSKDLSANRPKRNTEDLLEGKPIKHSSETKDSDSDQEQEFPHDSFNPRSRRHVGFYEHEGQKNNGGGDAADPNGDDAADSNGDDAADPNGDDAAQNGDDAADPNGDDASSQAENDGDNSASQDNDVEEVKEHKGKADKQHKGKADKQHKGKADKHQVQHDEAAGGDGEYDINDANDGSKSDDNQQAQSESVEDGKSGSNGNADDGTSGSNENEDDVNGSQ